MKKSLVLPSPIDALKIKYSVSIFVFVAGTANDTFWLAVVNSTEVLFSLSSCPVVNPPPSSILPKPAVPDIRVGSPNNVWPIPDEGTVKLNIAQTVNNKAYRFGSNDHMHLNIETSWGRVFNVYILGNTLSRQKHIGTFQGRDVLLFPG
jgi:hypothetical protein